MQSEMDHYAKALPTKCDSFYRKKYSESHNSSRVFELKSIKVKQSSESPLSLAMTIHSGKVNPVCEDL